MKIYKKLFEAKKEIGKISKDSKNPFFKSKYFDINSLLEHVEPILQKHSLLLLQPILEGKVITELIDIETGEKVSSEIVLPLLNDPQKLGSCVSYYRRYTAQSLLGLQATDDDANLASSKTKFVKTTNKPEKVAPVKVAPVKKEVVQKEVVQKEVVEILMTDDIFEKCKALNEVQIEKVFYKYKFEKEEQKEELQEIYNNLKSNN